MNRILIFGDSITYGAWDSRGGWADRLKQEAHSWTINSKGSDKYQVINLGIGGDTSIKILSRFKREMDSRYSSSWPNILIFAYGTNDPRTIDGKTEVSLKKFKSNTLEIIELAKQYTDKILFLSPPPLPAPEVKFKLYEYSDNKILEYDHELKSTAEAHELKYIHLRANFEKVGLSKLFCYDRLHPNDAGHQLIYEIVDKELQEYLD